MDKRGISSEGILYISIVLIVLSVAAMNFAALHGESPTGFVAKESCCSSYTVRFGDKPNSSIDQKEPLPNR